MKASAAITNGPTPLPDVAATTSSEAIACAMSAAASGVLTTYRVPAPTPTVAFACSSPTPTPKAFITSTSYFPSSRRVILSFPSALAARPSTATLALQITSMD
ncbi:MAG: hypothetical protein ABTQ32_32140 [Myxococcaceae bacterium]